MWIHNYVAVFTSQWIILRVCSWVTFSDGWSHVTPVHLVLLVQQFIQHFLYDTLMLLQQSCVEYPVGETHGDQTLHVRAWRVWSAPGLGHEVGHIRVTKPLGQVLEKGEKKTVINSLSYEYDRKANNKKSGRRRRILQDHGVLTL